MDHREQPIETHNSEVDASSLSAGVRNSITSRLPDSWTQAEIDQFIATYYNKMPEEVVDAEPMETAVAGVVEEMDESALAVSNQSRKGLTLDSYIILDGRSVTLRAIFDAGQLEPVRTFVHEGSKKFPQKRVLYSARIIDRPRVLTITEETYKALSDRFEQNVPHDEPLSAAGVKRVQAKTTVLTADTMERNLPDV